MMGIKIAIGMNRWAVVAARMRADGTMMVLRRSIPRMASSTQSSGLMPRSANTTSARSLNSVSTGPGQRAQT